MRNISHDILSYWIPPDSKIDLIINRDDRQKNIKTLEQLDLYPAFRKIVIESLVAEDYVTGPVIDALNEAGEMWAFGKDVKEREVYIKISLGGVNQQTICISFHIAECP